MGFFSHASSSDGMAFERYKAAFLRQQEEAETHRLRDLYAAGAELRAEQAKVRGLEAVIGAMRYDPQRCAFLIDDYTLRMLPSGEGAIFDEIRSRHKDKPQPTTETRLFSEAQGQGTVVRGGRGKRR